MSKFKIKPNLLFGGFFLIIIIVLLMLFGGVTFSILGDEFDGDVTVNDSWGLFLPSHPDARFPGSKYEIKHFNSTYIGSRSFFDKEDLQFNISGTMGSAFNNAPNPGMIIAPFTPESGSGSIKIENIMSRLYMLGLFVPPRSTEAIFGGSLKSDGAGFMFADAEKYCREAYGGTTMHGGCVLSGVNNDVENVDRIWGYFTIVNGEPVYWNEQLSRWFATTQLHSFAPAPFSSSFSLPKSSLKDYYNEIELVFMLDGKITKSITKFEIYIEPEECRSTTLAVRQTAISGGNTISLDPNANQLTFANPDGDFITENDPIFCHTLPVLKLKADGVDQDFFPYDSLIEGGTITVPQGETWLFFWKGELSSKLPIECVDGELYDFSTEACVPNPVFEYICEAGVFDESTLTCTVQDRENEFCSTIGATLVLPASGDSFCKKILSEGETCAGEIITENSSIICIEETQTILICDGFVEAGVCKGFPEVNPPSEFPLTLFISVIIMVIIVGGLLIHFSKR